MTTQTPSPVAAQPRRGPVDPRLLRYARSARGFFVALAAIALAQTAVIVAFAWTITTVIVAVIDGSPAGQVAALLGVLLAVVAVRALLIWVRESLAVRAAARAQSQLRTRLVAAVDRLGPDWLARQSTAGLTVTAGRGLDALEAYFARYLPQLVQTAIATPLILVVMWSQDWISGVTVLVTLPLIPVFMVLIGLATRAVQRRQWDTLHQLASRFSDTVRGLSTLIVFGRQHRAADSLTRVTDRYRVETVRVLRVSFLSGFALELLASLSVALIAVFIGFRLLDGSMALTAGLFVLLLAPEAYLPLRQVGVQFHAAAEGVAATEDVFAVLDAARSREGTRSADPTTEPVPAGRGTLTLSGLSVTRGERELPTVDAELSSGEVLLLEGPSGSGKSSVLAALRGAAPFAGTASWGGLDVRTLSPERWLGWAGQRPGLMAGTVAENIALGDPAPDHAALARAHTLAGLAGIETTRTLGVQGAGLSGGQAQRVSVARAFYRHLTGRAPVLALDEPSAALDAQTEAELWNAVRTLADEGAAVLLVSHRVSARAIADRVVSLHPSEVPA